MKHNKTNMGSFACAACGATDQQLIRTYRSHSPLFAKMELTRCLQCDLVFAIPPPTHEDLQVYNESYFDNAHGGLNRDPQALHFFSGIALLRLQHVLSYCRELGQTPSSVVEIGPGHGFFYEHMKNSLPDCRYTAIESDPRCHDRLRELGATVYEDFSQLEANSYDLLVMSHVLEHSAAPDEFLQSAMCFLKVNGIVFIEVPCRDYEFKAEDEPHLVFFDKRSMKTLFYRAKISNARLSYHGTEIHKIRKQGSFYERANNKWNRVRDKCGLGHLGKPSEITDLAMWAALKPYEPHLEHEKPSWWLRAMGIKCSADES